MNPRILAAFLCLATLSGCIIHEHDNDDCCDVPNPGRSGDVTFLWTLQDLRCDDVRDVKGVNIRIPGETLANGGRYDCTTAGVDGITLHDFAPGTYDFELQAVGYDNAVLYSGTGHFTINGDARVMIDLMRTGRPPSYGKVSWLFPNNATCFQAGATDMLLIIDGDLEKKVACVEGNGGRATATPDLAAGEHTIQIFAYSQTGQTVFHKRSTFTTRAYDPASLEFTLSPVGTLVLNWSFSKDGGRTTINCADARVSELRMNFKDSSGTWIFGTQGISGPCSPPTGKFETLAPGRYQIDILGTDSNGVTYESSDTLFADVVFGQTRSINPVLMAPTTQP
jgi:hypothetical protein